MSHSPEKRGGIAYAIDGRVCHSYQVSLVYISASLFQSAHAQDFHKKEKPFIPARLLFLSSLPFFGEPPARRICDNLSSERLFNLRKDEEGGEG